jgi:hypothetical protein
MGRFFILSKSFAVLWIAQDPTRANPESNNTQQGPALFLIGAQS